jgi:hypothetical protein
MMVIGLKVQERQCNCVLSFFFTGEVSPKAIDVVSHLLSTKIGEKSLPE